MRFTTFLIFTLLMFGYCGFSQPRKQTNWLKDKEEFEQRWRLGFGINVGEPSGIHIQLYRLCRICKQSITITKRMSVDVGVASEGLLISKIIEKKNPTWSKGGVRTGIDFKLYFKMPMNPYFGIGGELGSRKLDSGNVFSSDIVARIGLEQKIFGVKFSPTSYLNSTLFVEGKYNQCITHDFNYLLPSAGLRFHFL